MLAVRRRFSSVSVIEGLSVLYSISQKFRLLEDISNVLEQLGLVLFDDHDVISIAVNNRLRLFSLSQQCIHRENSAFENQILQQFLNNRDLIGLVIYRVLSQGQSQVVTDGEEHMGIGSTLFATAS